MADFTGIRPENVFRFFEEISKVPRGSGNTAGMTEYLENFCFTHNLDGGADDAGNVLLYKDATPGYEDAPTVILQAHVDMVCVKEQGSSHDFGKDAIELVLEGDVLRANGTTLGADDGIGVACILAILDDDTLAHPALECVFTVDEEIGMLGADVLDMEALEGRRLINLDSEDEGVLVAGCAGGIRVDSDIPIGRAVIRGMPVMVEISGLRGGHSGVSIHEARLNAIKALARYFRELDKVVAFSLCDISGGDKDNAIPVTAKSHFVVEEEDLDKVREFTQKFEARIKAEYTASDDAFRVILESGTPHKIPVMDPKSQDKVLNFLLLMPCGVAVLRDGQVMTSSNLGIVRTGVDRQTGIGHFVTTSLVRSVMKTQRDALADKICAHTEFLGGTALLKEEFEPWELTESSVLRETMQKVYKELYGKEMKVEVSHGGLECGVFARRIEGLDAVSIGPDIQNMHTAKETVSVSSVARTYDFLCKVLAELR